MQLIRKPTIQEEKLIEYLLSKSSLNISYDWRDGLLVAPMNDGEMGSLILFPKGKVNEKRKFGKQISEYQFLDIDGIDVIASLNVDSCENLFELDIWKTDFGKLLKIPDLR
jgi:hypothetical protein